jgi:hypothetical protein
MKAIWKKCQAGGDGGRQIYEEPVPSAAGEWWHSPEAIPGTLVVVSHDLTFLEEIGIHRSIELFRAI